MFDNQKVIRPRGTDRAKVIQVIVTESLVGSGTEADPAAIVKQYWDFDGSLLASDRIIAPGSSSETAFPGQCQ